MAVDLACRPASDSKTTSAWRKPSPDQLLLVGLLAAATLAIYYQVLAFQFLTWDDDVHITKNPLLAPVSLASIFRFWLHSYENLYIPVSYTFFAVEAALSQWTFGRLNAGLFHAGNLALHLTCVMLVFRLLSRLLANPLAAWAGALCFAVHPLQVESVAWISETRGLLSAAFSLAALCWYLPRRSASEETRSQSNDPFSARGYALASAMFVIALLAKPSAVAVPLLALAIDGPWLRRPLKRSLACLLPWLAISVLAMGANKLLQGDEHITNVPARHLRPVVACDALTFYVRKLAVPVGLGFDYGRTPNAVLSGTAWHWAWVVPTCLSALLLVSPNRRKWLTPAGIFVGGLLPVLGLVAFLYQDISTVADRYMYLPMLGVAWGLGLWLELHWSRTMFAATCLLLGAFAQLAWQQTSFWRDDISVFSRGVEITPQSYVAQYMLGTALSQSGRSLEAVDHFRAALALNPNYARAHNDLGATLLDLGNPAAAMKEVEAALAVDDHYPEAHVNLGNVFARMQKPGEAEHQYRVAIEQKPSLAAAELNWGVLRLEHGRVAEAMTHFRRAIEVQPRMADAHFRLGEALVATGDLATAESELRTALECDPSLAQAHNNLGAIDLRQHKLAEAAEQFDAALQLDPELVEARLNRGLIYLEQGDMARGAAAFRAALKLLPPDSPQAAFIRGELKKLERSQSEAD